MKKRLFIPVFIIGMVWMLGIARADEEPAPDGGPIPDGGRRESPEEEPIINIAPVELPNPLGVESIEGLLEAIVRWLRNIAAPIAAGMVIYGAYQMLFAAGEPEKISTGKRTILYTVIGYVIIWIGWGITKIIQDVVG